MLIIYNTSFIILMGLSMLLISRPPEWVINNNYKILQACFKCGLLHIPITLSCLYEFGTNYFHKRQGKIYLELLNELYYNILTIWGLLVLICLYLHGLRMQNIEAKLNEIKYNSTIDALIEYALKALLLTSVFYLNYFCSLYLSNSYSLFFMLPAFLYPRKILTTDYVLEHLDENLNSY